MSQRDASLVRQHNWIDRCHCWLVQQWKPVLASHCWASQQWHPTWQFKRVGPLGLFYCVCIVVAIGCGPADRRQAVTGSVTLDGKALSRAIINFRPAPGNQSNSAGAGLEDGEFKIAANQGLLPGDYKVIIQAFEETGRMIIDPQFGKVPETLMIRFQEEKTLEATVSEEGENRFDFELTRTRPAR